MSTSPSTPEPVDAIFVRMLADWQALAAESPLTDLDEWQRAIAAMSEDERRLRAAGGWVHGRDDVLGILGLERAEVRHSALLAWLCDSCARHGLGVRFLGGVLERAFPNVTFAGLADVRIECEVVRGPCRADIVLWLPDTTVVIENKVDAPESERQCDILFEEFAMDLAPRFILLTPSGGRPETATGAAADAFASLSYADVRTILATALDVTASQRAATGRCIAENYLRTLRREFR